MKSAPHHPSPALPSVNGGFSLLLLVALASIVLTALPIAAVSQPASTNQGWTYTLLDGSALVDDCPVCGRPTLLLPMRGTFDLRLIDENPLFATYAVENVSFSADGAGQTYKVTGGGHFEYGGEVALQQRMTLTLRIDDGQTNRLCHLTNLTGQVRRPWPMIQTDLRQTNGTPLHVFDLMLAAAPMREIWFSTAHGLTSGNRPPPDDRISDGDFLTHLGRVVRPNHELTARLGVMPIVPDLGLDGVDVLSGGEIAFSIEPDVFSETLGPLHGGDVLSDRGRVVAGFSDLIGAFGPRPPVADEGLDALHVLADGEIYFSITNDFFSEKLGKLIRRGDLLSSRGAVARTHEALTARFRLPPIPRDWGLDAVFVWPSGEIWFSVEEGFSDDELGPIQPGDLLSDQGYVVYRNLELVREFSPLEDLADFGLDGLFVVSDALPAAPPPRFTGITLPHDARAVVLEWEGKGKVFQIERADNAAGPYVPASPIVPDMTFQDREAWPDQPRAFYRLRQW